MLSAGSGARYRLESTQHCTEMCQISHTKVEVGSDGLRHRVRRHGTQSMHAAVVVKEALESHIQKAAQALSRHLQRICQHPRVRDFSGYSAGEEALAGGALAVCHAMRLQPVLCHLSSMDQILYEHGASINIFTLNIFKTTTYRQQQRDVAMGQPRRQFQPGTCAGHTEAMRVLIRPRRAACVSNECGGGCQARLASSSWSRFSCLLECVKNECFANSNG